jgi:nicotinamidase-related amidase
MRKTDSRRFAPIRGQKNKTMTHPKTLDKSKTALIVIDMQEAFRSSIADFDVIASRIARAVQGFQILEVPVIITEQYPKGLGRTALEILEVLPPDFAVIEKTAFSSCGSQAFLDSLETVGAKQIVLCGIETHICVNQTAHDLLQKGYEVHLLQDCVSSRFDYNKFAGIRKMQMNGAIPSSIEMSLFELMRDSKHEQFKAIQKLIK